MDKMPRPAPIASNVRYPLWQGWQDVAAVWFPAQRLSVAQRNQRVLDAWRAGSRAWRFNDGDLLCWAQVQSLQCAMLPGVALCRVEGVLHAAPLTLDERRALPAADLVLVRGAQPQPLRLEQAERLDLSSQLEVSALTLATLYPLQPPPLPAALTPPGKDVRAVVGDTIAQRSAATESLLQVMRGERPAGLPGTARQRVSGWMRDTLPGVGVSLLGRLAAAFAPAGGSDRASAGLAARRQPARPSALRRQMARLAMLTRVSDLLGYRQSAHLRRMMDMFTRGDLDEGLRNALPLNGAASAQSAGPAFGVPARRDALQVGARGGGLSIPLDPELHQNLERMYRAAFEQLDRRGRVDEALFVLAELLGARGEALDYMVKHARAREAAELAVGWDMPAPTLIRLLLLAGDLRRAVLVARRDNAFATAIAQMQRDDAVLADELRLEWARLRQRQGDWLGAVETAWPLAAAREEVLGWLLSAEQAGQALSARALMLRTALLPQTLVDHAQRIEALVDPEGDPLHRIAAADTLLQLREPTAAIRAMASHLLPALAADGATVHAGWPLDQLKRLLKLANNSVLSADVPDWTDAAPEQGQALAQRTQPLRLQVAGVAAMPISDAVVLDGGRCLVALGEAGSVMLDRQGRVLQRHRPPATRLVLADSGQVALAVAEREQVCQVARLDLVTGQSCELGSLAVDAMDHRFDGVGWTVQSGADIRVLDVSRNLREVLWHVDLPSAPVAHGFFRNKEVWLVRAPGRVDPWVFTVEGRRRIAMPALPAQDVAGLLACPGNGAVQASLAPGEGDSLELALSSGSGSWTCQLLAAGAAQVRAGCGLQMLDSGLLVTVPTATATLCFLLRMADGGLIAQIDWAAAAVISAREQGGGLLLHDQHGRLLQIDTASSASTTRVISQA